MTEILAAVPDEPRRKTNVWREYNARMEAHLNDYLDQQWEASMQDDPTVKALAEAALRKAATPRPRGPAPAAEGRLR